MTGIEASAYLAGAWFVGMCVGIGHRAVVQFLEAAT
jgi:hypothetical protein